MISALGLQICKVFGNTSQGGKYEIILSSFNCETGSKYVTLLLPFSPDSSILSSVFSPTRPKNCKNMLRKKLRNSHFIQVHRGGAYLQCCQPTYRHWPNFTCAMTHYLKADGGASFCEKNCSMYIVGKDFEFQLSKRCITY